MAEYRALLTDRERDVLTGTADVSQNYVYQIRNRVKEKIDRLPEDVRILKDSQPDLYQELQDALYGLI